MKKCFNVVLFMNVEDKQPSLEVIGSLIATFHQDFVVLNVLGVKSTDSIVGGTTFVVATKGHWFVFNASFGSIHVCMEQWTCHPCHFASPQGKCAR